MVHMEIKRKIFDSLVRELSEPEVLILLGPRQVGKSTLILALKEIVDTRGKTSLFLDLEQAEDLHRLT